MDLDYSSPINDVHISSIQNDEGYLYNSDDVIIIGDMRVFARNLEKPIYQGNIKFDFNVIVFCMKGTMQVRVNGEDVKVAENSIMLVPMRALISDVMVSPDAECIVLYITNRIMNQLLGSDIDEWHKIVFRDQIKTMQVDETGLSMVRSYYNLAKIKVGNKNNKYRHKMICALVQIALYEMLFLLQQQYKISDKHYGNEYLHGNQLFNRFLGLVAQTSPKYHPVSYYAEQLMITPKYLTVVCKQCSGKTSLEWIEEAVVEEIRFYLMQLSLPIKEVARMTGFDNPSFFGQYVKQHFGCTPMEYREKNK